MKRKAFGAIGDERGSAAVEFALVAPLFLALLFSILEAGWYFFVRSAVEQAGASASRLIRTGQAQDGVTRDQFFDKVCRVVDVFGDCNDTLTIDVSRFASFQALAADLSDPVCRDKDDPTIEGAQFDEDDYGAQREIVRVRICFLYTPINPALGLNLAQSEDGRRKITSVSIFRNEPFES